MKRLSFSLLLSLLYIATAFAGFSVSGTRFVTDSTDVTSGIDTLIVVDSTKTAYITYKAEKPYKFKWSSFDIDGNLTELKTEEEAVDTTFVALNDVAASGYLLQFDEETSKSAWVFRYADYKPALDTALINMQDIAFCDFVEVWIDPDNEKMAPAMEYKGLDGEKTVVEQYMTLEYDSIYFDTSAKVFVYGVPQFVESQDFTEFKDRLYVNIPSPLDQMPIKIYLNQYQMKMLPDSASYIYFPKPYAVESHVFASVRIREDALNENDKGDPKEPEEAKAGEVLQLKGSAPVNFEALNYSSPAAYHYVWYLSKDKDYKTLMVKAYDKDLRQTFSDQGTYYIKVEISNDSITADEKCWCKQTRQFQVDVRESQLEVPNVFTPNGDGINDLFKVAYRSIIEFHGWVYNQWGGLVYQWVDPTQGWDGTINGKPAADGAYMYIIEATGSDFDSDGKRVKYVKKGTVSIIR